MKNFFLKITLFAVVAAALVAAIIWGTENSRLWQKNQGLRAAVMTLIQEKADLEKKLSTDQPATPVPAEAGRYANAQLRQSNQALGQLLATLEKEKRDLEKKVVQAAKPKPEDRATLLPRIERQTSVLRGLPFKNPVTYKNIGRDELKKFLSKKMEEQYSSQEMRDYGRTLETLGLIPEGTDLMESILGLYDEQVAAFYVPEERALYTFKDSTLANNLDQVTMAHELTHALQDQNFDLTTFPLKIKDNDDLALATSALVEGDATLLMAEYYGEHLDVRNMLSDVLAGMTGQKTAKFQSVPPFFREMLLFPYQQGTEFATAVFAAGGTEALNAAFKKPPVSTREILHPEKFIRNRRDPVKPVVTGTMPADWHRIGDNVLGEFGLRSLLSQYVGVFEAQRTAEGWDGDRFHVYSRGTNGPCVLLWETAWETPADAAEFVNTYKLVVQKRGVVADIRQNGTAVSIRQAKDQALLAAGQKP